MSDFRPARPSDTGLAGERTTLAWVRMGLTLLGLPSALLAYSAGRSWLAFSAALVAALLGLGVLVGSLRMQRVGPDVIPSGSLAPAAAMILLTGWCAVMLGMSGALLVMA
jgi:uncharacterized membrane protein YidH (DUF202 family)